MINSNEQRIIEALALGEDWSKLAGHDHRALRRLVERGYVVHGHPGLTRRGAAVARLLFGDVIPGEDALT
jgi:hypothetical protein